MELSAIPSTASIQQLMASMQGSNSTNDQQLQAFLQNLGLFCKDLKELYNNPSLASSSAFANQLAKDIYNTYSDMPDMQDLPQGIQTMLQQLLNILGEQFECPDGTEQSLYSLDGQNGSSNVSDLESIMQQMTTSSNLPDLKQWIDDILKLGNAVNNYLNNN